MTDKKIKKEKTCSDEQVIIFADMMGITPEYLDNIITSNKDYCLRIIQESLCRGRPVDEIITHILTSCVVHDFIDNKEVRKPDKVKTECMRETIPDLSFKDISSNDDDDDDNNQIRELSDSMEDYKPLTQRELCLNAALNRISSKR
jgi:hypothetical protein